MGVAEMAGARVVLLLFACGTFFFVAVMIGVGVALFFLNRRRIMGAMGVPAQAVGILEGWARDEGCELLEVDWPKDLHDHPFADRFGVGLGKQPGIVLALKVRTPQGEVRRGWAYLRHRLILFIPGFGFMPETLELAWDE